jgi:hypothetical protein
MIQRAIMGAVFAICTLVPRGSHAQVGAGSESLLLLRVLAYDRNVTKRAGKTVTVAVVYKRGDVESELVRGQIATALSEAAKRVTVATLPVKVVSLGMSGNLDGELAAMKPAAAYVCPGLQDAVAGIAKITRARSILSFGGTDRYVASGLSIGLVPRSSKTAIVVNLPSSKAEGAALDAALLRVAEVKK